MTGGLQTTGQRLTARPAVAAATEQDTHTTYGQQEIGMPAQQATAPPDTIASTDRPGPAPVWADGMVVFDEMTTFQYESPGTFDALTGASAEPFASQRLVLEQLVVTEKGTVPRIHPATVRLANVDGVSFDGAEWPIEQARLMHAQLGHVLARFDAATAEAVLIAARPAGAR